MDDCHRHRAQATASTVRSETPRRTLKFAALLVTKLGLAALAAACTIADSNIFVPQDVTTHCTSQLGQYVLPKSVVHIAIDEAVHDGVKYNVINSITQEQYPLNETRYCFEYRPNIVSYDKVTAKTDTSGFLSFVTADAADQTGYVIKMLIRSIFVGISQNPNFRADKPSDTEPIRVADLFFDPFDIHETAAKNARLGELGFCLVLDRFTYRYPDTAQSYCDNPGKYLRINNEYSRRYREILDTTIIGYSHGLLYRPRVPYTLTLYTKADPDKPGGRWSAVGSEVMELENISPFVAVRMDRVAFAVTRLGFVFNAGELKNACIYKSSELKEVATIPLEIVKDIAALPTAIFQVQFDNVTGARQLAEAENSVIQAQIAYMAFLNKGTTGSTGGTPPKQPAATQYGVSDAAKISQLQFNDSTQTAFWDDICAQSGTSGASKTIIK